MGKFRKILVAIDGSESSKNALRESFKLATNEQSWITVVSVAPPYEGDLALMAIGNIQKAIKEPCEKALVEAEKIAKAERVMIKTVCVEGKPYERIIDLAEAENCDLIILGRKGMSRVERVLMGSVAARVIGYSPKDILVVPEDTKIGWKIILVSTDGSRYSKAATNKAIDFAKSYGGEIKAVSVVDVTEEFLARAPGAVEELVRKAKNFVDDIREKADVQGVKAETFVREGEPYKIITTLAKEYKSNVIVMGSHGRTGLKRLLMGSTAEKVIGYAPCPVLVVKPQ
jgi:nucleotide-binding universal stress UspA family protein